MPGEKSGPGAIFPGEKWLLKVIDIPTMSGFSNAYLYIFAAVHNIL